jgi:hypothetical protein
MNLCFNPLGWEDPLPYGKVEHIRSKIHLFQKKSPLNVVSDQTAFPSSIVLQLVGDIIRRFTSAFDAAA